MPAPTITALPPAPLRSQTPAVFTATAETFVEALEDLPTEINAFGAYLDSYTPPGGYTDEMARDAVAAALTEGAGIDIAVDDDGNTITIASTITQYTNADARAAIHAVPTTQSGTSYTADIDDAYGYILFTNAAAVAFEIPPGVFAVRTVIVIEQNNTGVVTLTPGAGVTLNSRGGLLDTAGQYAVVQLKQVATDVWTVIGDVA